jgi:hypothetical protein
MQDPFTEAVTAAAANKAAPPQRQQRHLCTTRQRNMPNLGGDLSGARSGILVRVESQATSTAGLLKTQQRALVLNCFA